MIVRTTQKSSSGTMTRRNKNRIGYRTSTARPQLLLLVFFFFAEGFW